MRDTFAAELLSAAQRDDRIMFVTGDLGFGVFEKFRREVPDQYLNVGVAEQNMVAVSTGLALEGKIVFAYSIGNFPVLRCLEQIRNDAAYHGANVKIVSIGGGFSYGPLGMSHHATEDIAVMRAIPDVLVLVPGTLHETALAFNQLLETPGTGYLRLDKSFGEEPSERVDRTAGQWRVLRHGDDVALIASGGVLGEAQLAANQLAQSGIEAQIVSAMEFPISAEETIRSFGNVPAVLTIEEHVTTGGLGSHVAEAIVDTRSSVRLTRVGIPNTYVSSVGSQQYLRATIGIDGSSIAARARELVSEP